VGIAHPPPNVLFETHVHGLDVWHVWASGGEPGEDGELELSQKLFEVEGDRWNLFVALRILAFLEGLLGPEQFLEAHHEALAVQTVHDGQDPHVERGVAVLGAVEAHNDALEIVKGDIVNLVAAGHLDVHDNLIVLHVRKVVRRLLSIVVASFLGLHLELQDLEDLGLGQGLTGQGVGSGLVLENGLGHEYVVQGLVVEAVPLVCHGRSHRQDALEKF
jgi:hypothetical protein